MNSMLTREDIQVNWNGRWITVATGYDSQDAAEWATAGWKQANQCFGDTFRAVTSQQGRWAFLPAEASDPKP